MLIVYGTAGLTLAVLLYAIVLIGCRNPRKPAWTHDFLVGNIYVPAMIVLCVLGLGCLFSFLVSIGRHPVDWIDVALAAGVAAGGLVLWKALGVKKRLADYAAGAVSGEVIQLEDVRAAQPPNHSPSTHPVKPTSGQRAA
jgi:amino acid transporter